jgi:hypothetical protein
MRDHDTYGQSISLTRCKFQVCRPQNLNTVYLCGRRALMPLAYLMRCKSLHDKDVFMLQGHLPCPLARAVVCPYNITCRLTYYYLFIHCQVIPV